MGFDRTIDFLPDAKHLSVILKSAFADILDELHGHIRNCSIQAHTHM